jgi:hypothetical protein
MAAGLLGLQLATTLLAAASMIGGSDDDPWDAEVALRWPGGRGSGENPQPASTRRRRSTAPPAATCAGKKRLGVLGH